MQEIKPDNTMYFALIGIIVVLLLVILVSMVQFIPPIEFSPPINVVHVNAFSDIRTLSDLTVIEHIYEDEVHIATDMQALQPLYGSEARFNVSGSVRAGLDLSQIQTDSTRFDRATRTAATYIPYAQIQGCTLDESKTNLIDKWSGPFASEIDFSDEVRKRSVQSFINQALSEQILETATARASELLRTYGDDLIQTFGEDNPINTYLVQPAPQPEEPSLPSTCFG